ncbi:MAG: hypothetical protein IPJ19_07115 [Planctomycetes bacterium]|nr:hypothetical protein [Planctomycetota bacterium]
MREQQGKVLGFSWLPWNAASWFLDSSGCVDLEITVELDDPAARREGEAKKRSSNTLRWTTSLDDPQALQAQSFKGQRCGPYPFPDSSRADHGACKLAIAIRESDSLRAGVYVRQAATALRDDKEKIINIILPNQGAGAHTITEGARRRPKQPCQDLWKNLPD